jgi:hypothetical protein
MIKVSIDRQVMQSVMKGLADQINSKIDLNHVKKLCKERYGIQTIKGVEHKNANIVVIENEVACKLDFEVRFPMSILITSKENSNSNLPENNDIPAEDDDMETAEFDDLLEEEFDEIPAELDEIPAELDDLPEDELDDILEEELDNKGKVEPLIGKGNKKTNQH